MGLKAGGVGLRAFRVEVLGLGFKAWGLGWRFKVWGLGFRVWAWGSKLGFEVENLRCGA